MTIILFPLWPASFYKRSEVIYNKKHMYKERKAEKQNVRNDHSKGLQLSFQCSSERPGSQGKKEIWSFLCSHQNQGSLTYAIFASLMCVFHALPVRAGTVATWWQLHSQSLMYQCLVNICHLSAGKQTGSSGEVTFPSTLFQEKFLVCSSTRNTFWVIDGPVSQ